MSSIHELHKNAFQCTPAMGESVPSLHRETTDSLICTYHLYLSTHFCLSCVVLCLVCACIDVNVNVIWEAPKLKGLFCLLRCTSFLSLTATCCRACDEHMMYFRVF